LWLGPVAWVGVAGFEELWRVVILRRLWLVFGSPAGSWVVLVMVSALVGALRGYQGPAAMVSIGFKSLLMGWYFKAAGRTRTLIVSHAVYDSVQIILVVLAIRAST
jgi:membrane protease YdiL (CAAX protease family)